MCMSVFTAVNVAFTGKTTLRLKTTVMKEKVQFTYVIVIIVVQILSIMYHMTMTSWTEKFMTPWKFAKLAENEE